MIGKAEFATEKRPFVALDEEITSLLTTGNGFFDAARRDPPLAVLPRLFIPPRLYFGGETPLVQEALRSALLEDMPEQE
jgi:hypothetical protein